MYSRLTVRISNHADALSLSKCGTGNSLAIRGQRLQHRLQQIIHSIPAFSVHQNFHG